MSFETFFAELLPWMDDVEETKMFMGMDLKHQRKILNVCKL